MLLTFVNIPNVVHEEIISGTVEDGRKKIYNPLQKKPHMLYDYIRFQTYLAKIQIIIRNKVTTQKRNKCQISQFRFHCPQSSLAGGPGAYTG